MSLIVYYLRQEIIRGFGASNVIKLLFNDYIIHIKSLLTVNYSKDSLTICYGLLMTLIWHR